MQLELNAQELDELETILRRGLGDLREEVYKSETAEYKDALRAREVVLSGLLERVRALKTRA